MKKRVGLVFGGRSGEHEVSLVSASNIEKGFDKNKYEVFPILISREGKWYGPIPNDEIKNADAIDFSEKEIILAPYPGGVILSTNTGTEVCKLDCVFPIVHGNNGEDGVLQGLLEQAGIPYAGPGVAASSLCMDKVMMKKLLHYHNIPMVEFVDVHRKTIEMNPEEAILQVERKLQYPVFVKPSNGGSSVGAGKAGNKVELLEKMQLAAKYDTKVLVERAVSAREIEVAVLGNEAPMASLPGEIVSCNEFYDYEAKYIAHDSKCRIPADLTEEQTEQIRKIAVEVFRALECEGMSRVDFFIDKEDGNIYLNEVNTLPGFTDISMYPKMCEAMGIPLPELLDRLMQLAEEKFRERGKNSISV